MAEKNRFYTDEHIALAIASTLRQRGVDIISAKEANLLGASDDEHLALAIRTRRTLVSMDADFLRIHSKGMVHPGIVFVPGSLSIREIVRRLFLVYQVFDDADMENRVEYL